MKINTTQEQGREGLKNLIRLTKPKKESFKEKHERIKQEVLREVFK